ncbi:hypothetical protein AO242_25520 [Pseudomonas sp. ICMP 561]|nr:hypothetical protein AO242_25520 [Pseudomonas sp. ICMP 561]
MSQHGRLHCLHSLLCGSTLRHAFILLQTSRTVFKVGCDDLATRRHLCIDKLLAEAQSLVTTQLELTTHGTVL